MTKNQTLKEAIAASQAGPAKKDIDLFDKTLAVEINIRRLGISKQVNPGAFDTGDVSKDWISITKKLIDCDEYKVLDRFDANVYQYMKARCLPSVLRRGIYLCPIEILQQVDAELEQKRAQRDVLIEKFLEVYPAAVERAKKSLDKVFNDLDYPSVKQAKNEFSFNVRYISFGVPQSLRQIDKEIFARESERARQEWVVALEAIQKLLRENMLELVNHMVDRLTPDKDGNSKKFTGTLVPNMTEFLNSFDPRNVAEDADLKKIVDKAKNLLKGVESTEALKDNNELRDSVQKGFSKLQAELGKFVTVEKKAKRKIRFDDKD